MPGSSATARVALVLGAGGTVGVSYHAGALRALERVGGLRPDDAGLMVGTSAGSVVGAYLRSGWGTEDLWQEALAGLRSQDAGAGPAQLFAPRFRGVPDLARRALGSTYVLGRSILRGPAPVAPRWLGRLFPGGLFEVTDGRRRLADDLPLEWPARALWLCAVDITNGRRVVLGRAGEPPLDLRRAVVASCAIPGLYQPVGVGGHALVDGAARSDTNLDLAASPEWDLVIAVAPTTFDPSHRPGALMQLARRASTRRLAAEAAMVRERGAEVLLVRPTASDIGAQGVNFMRATGLARVAVAAYDATARALETPRFRRALDTLAA